MSGLNVEIRESPDGPVAKLTGRLDGTGVDRLQLHLNRFLVSRPPRVTFDLAELTFVSSLGLGSLVSFQHQMSRHRGHVVLACMQRDVRSAVSLSGLERLFVIRDSLAPGSSSGGAQGSSPSGNSPSTTGTPGNAGAPPPQASPNRNAPPAPQVGFTGAATTPFEVRVGGAAHSPVVRLIGELHVPEVDRLQLHLSTLEAHRPRRVVFDLSGLSFISSLGLGALVTFQHKIRRNQGEVILAGIQPNIREMLHVARLDQILTIRDSVAEA